VFKTSLNPVLSSKIITIYLPLKVLKNILIDEYIRFIQKFPFLCGTGGTKKVPSV